ncbi:YitT family protein [Anaerocolumna sp. AGMB13025]|uniref:YitT family protein n=1 Tax=Anaerocolumna sp. AGMB13025 TaxID=3039116 RepID=UPI00241CDD5F|nr:YitT family protein [Anaerocolumna sp. AGMB13025]WFR55806.1 YitT family protein [Anaerocolumna sp. AGMB13025]
MIYSNDKKISINAKRLLFIILGTGISSFGIYNIHRQTNITEGGVLGLILLLNNWTGLSPAILTPLLDLICYAFAFRYLGKDFIKISLISTLSLAGFFKLWEMFPPVLPNLTAYPLIAAIGGGLFVGTGVGLIIGQGASSGGDDALALILSKLTHCRISRVYLATDLTILLISLSYIPIRRIAYSLVTVTVSSLLIEYVQKACQKDGLKTGMQLLPYK